MDLKTLINTRQSCRSYSDKPISREDIVACLDAARMAPTARNSQMMHFTVCTGDLAKQVAEATKFYGINKFADQAPCLIVITADPVPAPKEGERPRLHDFRDIDIGIATSLLTLRATDLGLSTCILGSFSEEMVQSLIGTQDSVRLVITLGYASEDDKLRDKKRKAMDVIADFR